MPGLLVVRTASELAIVVVAASIATCVAVADELAVDL